MKPEPIVFVFRIFPALLVPGTYVLALNSVSRDFFCLIFDSAIENCMFNDTQQKLALKTPSPQSLPYLEYFPVFILGWRYTSQLLLRMCR